MRSMAERRRRGASRSSTCFQTSSAFGFLLFMVDLERKVDTPELESLATVNSSGRKKDQDLTQRIQSGARRSQRKKSVNSSGQRKDRDLTEREPGGKCGAKRKRAKPRSARRFTRELLYLDIC